MGRASWFNEFIPYDFANLLPHSFAFHTNRQIGDVLVYTGAGTGIAANGYSWQQQTNSSSSLTIENSQNATSIATKVAQTVGSGLFYQNETQLRVQYKSSSSNFFAVLVD